MFTIKSLQNCKLGMVTLARPARVASFVSTALLRAKTASTRPYLQPFDLDSKHQDNTQFSSKRTDLWQQKQQRRRSATDKKFDKFKQALAENNIDKALSLYQALRDHDALLKTDVSEAADGECSMLLRILHTGLRLNNTKLHRFRFHGSADQKATLQDRCDQLLTMCTEIANDMYTGRANCRAWGAMHLLTAHLTAGQPSKGVALWQQLISEDSHCRDVFLAPRVVGSAIRLLHAANRPLDEIEEVYKRACTQEAAANDQPSSNLALEMIPVWLHYGRQSEALREFEQLITDSNRGLTSAGAQTLYNCIIGQCEELEAVTAIIDTVFAGTTPFNISLHPVEFTKFMRRFALHTDNLEAVQTLWEKYIQHVPTTEPEWRLMVVTKVLLDSIFTKHPIATPEAVTLLRNMLENYKNARCGSIPGSNFLITLLLRFNEWSDRDVTLSLIDLFRLYNVPITPVEARAILMSFKGIDVELALISKYWKIIDSAQPKTRQVINTTDSNQSGKDVALTAMDIDSLWKCTVQTNRSERIVFFENIFSQILHAGPSRLSDSELFAFYQIIRKRDYSRYEFLVNVLEKNKVVVNLKEKKVHRSVFAS